MILLTITLLAIIPLHFNFTRDENGFLLTIGDKPVDVAGLVSIELNRLSRNCEYVVRLLPTQEKYVMAQRLIENYSPPDSHMARISSVWSMGTWLLVEVEFNDLLPSVVLIQNSYSNPSIVPDAVWSGFTNPRKSAPYIRSYIQQKINTVPDPLLRCFEPQSQSFI